MSRKEAIGLIEAIGLATAVEAADAAVKSANVRLIGYETCRENGMTTIKVAGDVGAVKAAVEAATAACVKGRGIWGSKVIARPSEGIEKLIYNSQTIGYTPPEEIKKETKQEIKEETKEETKEEIKKENNPEVDENVPDVHIDQRKIILKKRHKKNSKLRLKKTQKKMPKKRLLISKLKKARKKR